MFSWILVYVKGGSATFVSSFIVHHQRLRPAAEFFLVRRIAFNPSVHWRYWLDDCRASTLWKLQLLVKRFSPQNNTYTHPFNRPLSGAIRVSLYQKCKTNLDFTEARDSEWQWHQLGRMQVYTSLQTDNHASTPPLSFLQAGCPSCRQNNGVKALKAVPQNTYRKKTERQVASQGSPRRWLLKPRCTSNCHFAHCNASAVCVTCRPGLDIRIMTSLTIRPILTASWYGW